MARDRAWDEFLGRFTSKNDLANLSRMDQSDVAICGVEERLPRQIRGTEDKLAGESCGVEVNLAGGICCRLENILEGSTTRMDER